MDFEKLFEQIQRNAITCEFGGQQENTGLTHFGGQPDVPEGFQWPWFTFQDGQEKQEFSAPLAFLAQFDCAELAAYDSAHELPDHGVLSFFYDLDEQFWGFDPQDKGCARVYWFEDSTALHPSDFPDELKEYCRLPRLNITLGQMKNVPDYEEYAGQHNIDPGQSFYDEYAEERVLYGYETPENSSKLLGYADVIQGDMTWECTRVANGIYCGGGPLEGEAAKKSEALNGQESEWKLLFQMDSFMAGSFELIFGDSGRIYFYIRQQDLENRDFDKAWLILQCY